MSGPALQNGPPNLDRLQLVAALIEYDNEDAPPEKRRDHRQSAIFTQFRPRPLDHLPPVGPPRPLPSRSQTHQPHASESMPIFDARSRPTSMAFTSPPRVRDSVTMEILEGRKRFDPNATREDQGWNQEQEQEPVEEVDVSRWGLPDHLVAKEEPLQRARPSTSMSTNTQVRPASSASRFVPEMRPISTMSMDPYSDTVKPESRPFPAARTTSVMTPTINRARSVHLDVMGEADEFGAETALESAARIRRLIVESAQGMVPMADRDRTRSGGSIGTRPDRGSRRVSFNELDLQNRPHSSMGPRSMSRSSARTPPTSPPALRPRSAMRRQSSNPLMVPLPVSPMHALYATTADYLPSIAGNDQVEPEVGMLPDSEYSTPNPFAMPAPPAVIGSRFDPKQLEGQRAASRLSSNPRPETSMSLQRSSLDMFADMARPTSIYPSEYGHDRAQDEFVEEQDLGEMRIYDDIPTAEQYGKPLRPPKYSQARPQRMSRIDLLRPKTLLMPTPLVNQPPPPSPPKKKWEVPPEGFSIGEKPLPPGARTSVLTINGVPRIPMSLSQRTFRSSLLVGGERGEAWVGGAEEDGEVGITKKEREDLPAEVFERKAGKLYGKSLIDQLEARKAAMKGRQRYFTGDSRPAMMERSTFDTAGSDHVTSPTNARAPLLQFDDNGDLHRSPTEPEMPHFSNRRSSTIPTSTSLQLPPPRPIDRLTKSTSVFGVDQIWERETAKLKLREAREAEQAAIDRQRQEEEDRRKAETKGKKKKEEKKGKGKESVLVTTNYEDQHQVERDLERDFSPINRVPDLPPMLEFSPEKAPAPELPSPRHDPHGSNDMSRRLSQSERTILAEAGSDSESEEDVPLARMRQTSRSRPSSLYPQSLKPTTEQEESSDEDGDVPLARLRKSNPPSRLPSSSSKPGLSLTTDLGPGLNLEDPPLSATGSLGLNVPVPQSASEMTQPTKEEIGADDDVPLLLRQAHIKALAPPRKVNDDDDDDVPLGVRQSMLLSSGQSGFRPPDPSMYAQGQGFMYGGGHPHPHLHPASMYGGYPPTWGQAHPHMGMPMHGWPPGPAPVQQHPMMHNGYPFRPPPPPMMNMGHMSFPDLTAMMQAQGQGFPIPSEKGAGELQGGNIDSWRKGVDPAVAPPPSVGGVSRRS